MIPNGLYFLHFKGADWIAVRILRGGRQISISEQCQQELHADARDSWAGIAPSEEDEEVDAETAAAIVQEVIGEESNPECVIVTRAVTTAGARS